MTDWIEASVAVVVVCVVTAVIWWRLRPKVRNSGAVWPLSYMDRYMTRVEKNHRRHARNDALKDVSDLD